MTKFIDYTKYPLPRIRHHANPVLYFPLKQHKGNNFYYPPVFEKLEWNEIFSSGKPPDMLDIGCGLGRFLLETSLKNSDKNILGFEVRQTAVEWIKGVIEGEKLPNVQALWYSAVNGMSFIETGSIEKVFYFFPDPWVKKKQNKRRAFSAELLKEIHRVLKPEGNLYLMTDVPEVDEYQQSILNETGLFEFRYTEKDQWDLQVRSNHEIFCEDKGIPFIRMTCRKKQ
ncbi:MAG TPA: tRNA (guanosine(46)-N7)-methyltransferase TrmB [Ignavibacteria bacterium]|nr:tRNA (guanosine(46)-N7)-methyltransferase TrmB [Ignavibacteria bacterium]HRF66083.1 tRNA (guanosine(46)-N7)-methyltransferase TrmB [Ignavibacteria bacterium]